MLVPDGEEPEVTSGTLADITEGLTGARESVLAETFFYVFYGLRAEVSVPPYRYLLWPGGDHRTPLFQLPEATDIETDDSNKFTRGELPLGSTEEEDLLG